MMKPTVMMMVMMMQIVMIGRIPGFEIGTRGIQEVTSSYIRTELRQWQHLRQLGCRGRPSMTKTMMIMIRRGNA